MPVVQGSFTVAAPAEVAFEVTNRLEDWPRLSPGCEDLQLLEQEGYKTVFRMTLADGSSWVSQIFRLPAAACAYSERRDPPAPFSTMQYIRTYREDGDGRTQVTEKVNYELRERDPDKEREVAQRMEVHMAELHPRIKAHIEDCAARRM